MSPEPASVGSVTGEDLLEGEVDSHARAVRAVQHGQLADDLDEVERDQAATGRALDMRGSVEIHGLLP